MDETAIRSEDIIRLIGLMSDIFTQHRKQLIELDSQLGDGDLGIYMASGMSKAYEAINQQMEETPGKLLRQVGRMFAEEAPSTMGTLIAGAFMAAGKSVLTQDTLSTGDIVTFLEQMGDAIMKRGGAKEGDKTILDTLLPAARSARNSFEQQEPLRSIMTIAYKAASDGMECAKGFKAVHGRPGYFGDQTIGKYDGGTVVGVLLLKSLQEWTEI
jgi:dihydroxyacetone kinase-like protein